MIIQSAPSSDREHIVFEVWIEIMFYLLSVLSSGSIIRQNGPSCVMVTGDNITTMLSVGGSKP